MHVPAAAMGEYAKQGDSLDKEWSGLLQRWGSQGCLGRQSGLAERQSGPAESQFGSLGRQSSRGQMGRQPSFPSGYVVVEETQSREYLTRQASTGQNSRQSMRKQNLSESHHQSIGTKVSNGNLNGKTSHGHFTKQTSKGQLKGQDSQRRQTNPGSAQADVRRRSRSKSATRRSRSKSSSPSRLFASTASSRAKQTDASTGTTKAPPAKKSSRISRSTNRSQSTSKSLRPKSTSPTRARQPIEANSSPVTRRRSSSDDWRNASWDEEEGPLASYLSFKQFAAYKRQNTLGGRAAGPSQQITTSSINKYKKTSHSHQSSILANKSYGLSATQSSSFDRKISESGRSYSSYSSSSTVTRQKKSVSPSIIALSTLKEAKVTPSASFNRGSTNFQQRMSSSFKRKGVSSTFIG